MRYCAAQLNLGDCSKLDEGGPVRRMHTLTGAIILTVVLATCQQAYPDEPINIDPFRACVDRKAKAAASRIFKQNDELHMYGYHTTTIEDVLSICDQAASNNPTRDELAYVGSEVEKQFKTAMDEKIHKEVEADRRKAELDAPRLKAEKTKRMRSAMPIISVSNVTQSYWRSILTSRHP
jgi:hypothetical protein